MRLISEREEARPAKRRWPPWLAALFIILACALFWALVARLLGWSPRRHS